MLSFVLHIIAINRWALNCGGPSAQRGYLAAVWSVKLTKCNLEGRLNPSHITVRFPLHLEGTFEEREKSDSWISLYNNHHHVQQQQNRYQSVG